MNTLAKIESSMAKLDAIAASACLSIDLAEKPFTQAIATAQAMQSIRQTLDLETIKAAILPLMNSRLGFRTDKDPSRPVWNKRNGRMETPEPYGVETVRECLIEATLRGLPPVGNCFNIISSNAYVTKEGFWYLMRHRVPGLTDFKVSIGVPKMIRPAGDAKTATDEDAKGAVVPCSASWRMNGKPDQIEREIPIRINSQMGTDAIMGKAERKILAAAYAQITGTTLGEGDVADHDAGEIRDATPKAAPKIEPIETVKAPVDAAEGYETPPPKQSKQPKTTQDVTAAEEPKDLF